MQCVQDILGAANPCIECICEIIDDICGLFGCDLNCHPTTVSPHWNYIGTYLGTTFTDLWKKW